MSVEQLLTIAGSYARDPLPGRVNRLCRSICELFDCDGCVVSLARHADGIRIGSRHGYEKDSARAERQLKQLSCRRFATNDSTHVLHTAADGGPAIVIGSALGRLIVYRSSATQRFSSSDVYLIACLWNACTGFEQNGGEPSVQQRPGADNAPPPRLRQVMDYLLTGLTEKEIANRLDISRHTVHVYVKDIYRREGVTSRSRLLAKCLARNSSAQPVPPEIANAKPAQTRHIDMPSDTMEARIQPLHPQRVYAMEGQIAVSTP